MFDPVDNTIQPLTNHSLGAYRSYYHFPGFYGGWQSSLIPHWGGCIFYSHSHVSCIPRSRVETEVLHKRLKLGSLASWFFRWQFDPCQLVCGIPGNREVRAPGTPWGVVVFGLMSCVAFLFNLIIHTKHSWPLYSSSAEDREGQLQQSPSNFPQLVIQGQHQPETNGKEDCALGSGTPSL